MIDFVDAVSTIGWAIFGYYLVVSSGYVLIHLAAIYRLRHTLLGNEWDPVYDPLSDPLVPDVTIVVPAYNEEAVILESAYSFLNVNYPEMEVMIVNDGSSDGTLDVLREEFALERIEAPVPVDDIPCEPIRDVYESATHDLRVVDKENGGKGDAQNAAVWLIDTELYCISDADTIMEPSCLSELIQPFLEHPGEMVAVGSPLRVTNGAVIEDGLIERPGMSSSVLANFQKVEYMRAFLSGRIGLNQLQSLLIISGAFGLFRTDIAREMGGYDSENIVEDIEFTIRLHRHLIDRDRSYKIAYEPVPLVWTQVPEDRATLSNQRRRWYRGLVETMVQHRDVLFNPRYGRVGLFAVPFFLFAEGFGRLIEASSYVLVPAALFLGVVDANHLLVVTVLTAGFGVFLTWLSIFTEAWGTRSYTDPRDIAQLMGYAVLEFVGYRQWRTLVVCRGLVEYLKGQNEWGAMKRTAIGSSDG